MQLYTSSPAAIQCPSCLRWWKPGNTACCVAHLGDDCCRHGDTEVPAPQPA